MPSYFTYPRGLVSRKLKQVHQLPETLASYTRTFKSNTMLSKPSASKPQKPAAASADKAQPQSAALLPSEIIYAFDKLKDDALIIEHQKMRANTRNTTFFGQVSFNRLDPRKPDAPPVKTPLRIMIVGCQVSSGCRKKTEKDKDKVYTASFTTKSTFTYNNKVEPYGEARIRIAEAYKRKMEKLMDEGHVEHVGGKGKGSITTGVQMDVADENDKPTPGKKPKRNAMPRDDYIIRVKIPFKKEKDQQVSAPNAEPECIIRDIAQSKKGEDGRRKYTQPVMVMVEGEKVPLTYGTMPNFLLGGSEITGIEFCDSWSNSEMACALEHKFKEIIVKRGTGSNNTSIIDAIDDSYFDKMAEGANTDETIAAAQTAAAVDGTPDGTEGGAPVDVEPSFTISPEDLPPADPVTNEDEEFGDDLDAEAPVVKTPAPVVKAPAVKAAPKLTTPAEQKPKSPATATTTVKPAAVAAPKTPVVKGGKKPAATPPPAPTLSEDDGADLDLDGEDF